MTYKSFAPGEIIVFLSSLGYRVFDEPDKPLFFEIVGIERAHQDGYFYNVLDLQSDERRVVWACSYSARPATPTELTELLFKRIARLDTA